MEEKATRIPTRGAAKSYEGFGRAPVSNVVGQSLSESRCMQPITPSFEAQSASSSPVSRSCRLPYPTSQSPPAVPT